MSNPTKAVFDFPREQWDNVELRNADGGWNSRIEWRKWFFDYAAEREARLVKREPRTVSGECSGDWRSITLGGLALNIPSNSAVHHTIAELIPGAEPEPDWKAECERLTKRIGELEQEKSPLVELYKHRLNVLDERYTRIRELEAAKATDAAAISDRDKQIAALEKTRDAYLDRITELSTAVKSGDAERERLQKRVNEMVDVHQQERVMDRFQAAKWMVEHPGQRMVDSDGDEWWFDNGSGRHFCSAGEIWTMFCWVTETCEPFTLKQERPKIEPHRRKTKPWADIAGNVLVRIPERFRGQTVELEVKVCDG